MRFSTQNTQDTIFEEGPMSVYECDFCHELKDDDYSPCTQTPTGCGVRRVLDGSGVICDDCQGQFDDQVEMAAEARREMRDEDD